jgi:uncharacterized protein YqhQ
LSNLFEGIIRLVLVVGYIWAVGFVPDIRRVFAYHGAEHKTINAYEAHAPLEPAVVQTFTALHPRCGTGFLLVVVVVSVLVFSLLGRPPMLLRIVSRIALVPIIAGLSYEIIKFSGAHQHHRLVRWIMAPSLALQRLSTHEPSLEMLEVAITALQKVLADEGLQSEPEGGSGAAQSVKPLQVCQDGETIHNRADARRTSQPQRSLGHG